MAGDFSIIGRIRLAFEVMARWETLVTLGAFVALWLLARYVADPWRNEGRRTAARSFKSAKKPEKAPEAADAIDEDDELPD
ncbi:MAG: hypothetical protein KKA67_14355 [Spirochaetes bacterium]|nr:hypothetical protein [Spirochaetota bacterium]MBU1081526.1 hypothetical protein [Spirochaetota bacterium]